MKKERKLKTKTITFKDLTGQKFGKLTVLKLDHIQNRTRFWLCECDCELHNKKVVKEIYLTNGSTQSCGCLKQLPKSRFIYSDAIVTENNRKLYNVWRNMMHRCYNRTNNKYEEYGAKGIKICDVWKDSYQEFESWSLQNGYKEGLALIRRNNQGNYEPKNCIWDLKVNYHKIQEEYENSKTEKTVNEVLNYFEKNQNISCNSLTILYDDVIPIYDNNNERIVNARELHDFLKVKTKFADWIRDKIIKYNFTENEDYVHVSEKKETSTGATVKQEYYLKMDTAKEISMVENNEQGRYIRKYFIEIEKRFKNQNKQQPTNSIEILENIVSTFKQQQGEINSLSENYSQLKEDHEQLKNKIDKMVKAIS